MELLAPAGSYHALVAAVEAGADAVYAGGKQFSARRQAANLDDEELQRAVAYCHLRDRRLYMTVNTLIADTEMEGAVDYIFRLQGIGVDGIIVQDLGLMHRCRQLFPRLRLHASTQMTIHNQDGVRWATEQGLRRVVLARELSLAQVKMIQQECPQMELEIFVHGALCFSFSGQCLFSSLVGGRSGNRGNCAQPCRLPYQLYSEAGKVDQLAGQHLLSPADLCLLSLLQEAEEAGVTSLKIEGRMKRPEYVATVTRVYRQALDHQGRLDPAELQQARQELTAAFNRNFTAGFTSGEPENWLSPLRPNNRGIPVGRIDSAGSGTATISLKEELRIGDGIEAWTSSSSNAVTVIRRVMMDGREVSVAPAGSKAEIEMTGVAPGDRVFKTSDADLVAQAQELASENRWAGRRQVALWCRAYAGEPFSLGIRDVASGLEIEQRSVEALSLARGEATGAELIKDKIGELGDTPFAIQELKVETDMKCLVPFSWIKEVRRRAVAELYGVLLADRMPPRISQKEFWSNKERTFNRWKAGLSKSRRVMLTVAVNRTEAGKAALQAGADRVYVNMAGVKGHPVRPQDWDELLAVRRPGQQVLALLPRIILPGEGLPAVAAGDGAVMTNPGWLAADSPLKAGDYSLNVFNSHTADYLLSRGLDTICASPELNLQQLKALAVNFPGRLECVVYGDIPIMTSRFCLLGHMSGATSCSRCSRPCTQHSYRLHDRKGYEFPLRTDYYGRFYLYNSRTLCVLEEIKELIAGGMGALRLDLSLVDAEAVHQVTAIHRRVIDQAVDPTELSALKERLRRLSVSDFTKLHYYRGVI